MSTEDEVRVKLNQNKKEPTEISLEIDSKQIEDLVSENVDLKTKLQLIAEKEFSAQLKRFHLPEGSTPEELKQAMSLEKKEARGGDTLSWSQNIGEEKEVRAKTDLGSILTDNTEEGLKSTIEFLNWKKRNGTQEEKLEAQKLLGKAEKRIFSKNKTTLDAEFQGDIHALTRHELPIPPNATDEQIQKIEAYNSELRRKRSNWKSKE